MNFPAYEKSQLSY